MANKISFFTLNIPFKWEKQKYYKRWINMLATQHHFKISFINFIFCDDPYIRDLNNRFLRHDYCTDVITFDYAYLCSVNQIAGDIYIGIETVQKNAVTFNASSFEEELARVMSHGLFHLLGYNDLTPKEKLVMRENENKALAFLKTIDSNFLTCV